MVGHGFFMLLIKRAAPDVFGKLASVWSQNHLARSFLGEQEEGGVPRTVALKNGHLRLLSAITMLPNALNCLIA
jgi:hypothetical protein